MDHALLVGAVHGGGEGLHQNGCVIRGQRRAVEPVRQAAASAKFEREERQALVLAHLEHLHDVGMLQPGDGLGLGAKAGQVGAAGVPPRQDHLESDYPTQGCLPRPVNNPHPPASQLAEDLVPGDAGGGVPGDERRRLRRQTGFPRRHRFHVRIRRRSWRQRGFSGIVALQAKVHHARRA
jgi:hypothetical protein